ncbi:ribbon-helix-helix domain-containing protein [Nitratireductor sp. CAU 1489]|uniref:Ribbon-helix-helix domain-containing protein n=1 Tax=Nitratireductor arenosus TaxID=2682096 RepID=A0A844QFD2_9HYPH|nr:ribbon-helix-helix domain-containing protein [Nitratireductor arenosus]
MTGSKATVRETKVPISAQVDERLYRRLTAVAARTGLPNAHHIRQALLAYLEQHEDSAQGDLDL